MTFKKVHLVYIAVLLFSWGCKKDKSTSTALTGDWVQSATFEGAVRSNAVGFTINNKGYVGTGFDGSNRLKDFWEYDPALNFWEQKADFPGVARSEAVGFGIGDKGYLGTGYDGTNFFKDFYEYDPTSNTWTQKADFGGTARYGAVAFSVGGQGYIGTGFDSNNKKDFWTYVPGSDSWSQIVSPGGDKRIDAISFVIKDKAYVCAGTNNGTYNADIWEYDYTTGGWTGKEDLVYDSDDADSDDDKDVRRSGGVAFVINERAYIATGNYSNLILSAFEYNPATNTWQEVVNFEGSSRTDAVGLTIANRGYVVGGKNGNTRYDDLWEFTP